MVLWLKAFAHDAKVHVLLLLLLVDFALGVIAAFKQKNFRLSYVSDFLRNDVLFKIVPYFVIYAAALVAGHTNAIVIPGTDKGLDFGFVAGALYVTIIASMSGSILASVKALGFLVNLPNTLAGTENAAPPKD